MPGVDAETSITPVTVLIDNPAVELYAPPDNVLVGVGSTASTQ